MQQKRAVKQTAEYPIEAVSLWRIIQPKDDAVDGGFTLI